jgi:hypothetical protein
VISIIMGFRDTGCYINQAYMILLHKKKDVTEVKDYLSISLIHSFSKLVAKVLSA